jgi:uncharacterized protein involved in response to NO
MRPFFLLAGLYAVLPMVAWLAWLGLDIAVFPGGAPVSLAAWHGHEMVFGFAAAVIGGFMLTAVPNWTGAPPLGGPPLAMLAALWLAGRVAMWLPGLVSPVVVASLDLVFLPVLGIFVAGPLLRAGQRRQLIFLVLLAILFAANLLFHLDAAGLGPDRWDLDGMGNLLGVNLVILLVTIVGGRVISSFTGNWLRAEGVDAPIRQGGVLDGLTIAATAAVLVADVAEPYGMTAGALALAAAALHLARLAGWRTRLVLGCPILWILHLGYAWLVVGFACKGAALLFDLLPPSAALHALTVGAIGSMTLGVMSRAALGHTGRELRAAPAITVAYVLVSVAAVLRMAGLVLPSGGLWALAFAIFTVVYFPILVRPGIKSP